MPRIKKPDYLEYTNCMPDRIPDIGEKVWLKFGESSNWIECKVSGYDYEKVKGFKVSINYHVIPYGQWWWTEDTFYNSNANNTLRIERIPKQNETKT